GQSPPAIGAVAAEVGMDAKLACAAYGQPTPAAGAWAVSNWPVRELSVMCSVPRHWVATMNRVVLFAPPSAQEKQPRSSWIACSTPPPSRTRTHCLLGTSAYQMAPSASRQMPSGTPSPRSAHTRGWDRLPSAAIWNAVSFWP